MTTSPTLLRAREARASYGIVYPSELWMLARDEHPADKEARSALYRHALLEAGMLVERATGAPWRVCPECGWKP